MDSPLVSVIMPSSNRNKFLPLAIEYFLRQDYKNKELIIIHDAEELKDNTWLSELPYHESITHLGSTKKTIGAKRNLGCRMAQGKIISHQDSDDLFKNDWLTKSAEHLLKTGADMTGLSSAYFYQPNKTLYLYQHNKNFASRAYVVGGTMCYKRSFWEQHPFQDRMLGEDLALSNECNNIIEHDYINGFVAILHGNNTSSHQGLGASEFTQIPIERIRDIMGSDLEKYKEM